MLSDFKEILKPRYHAKSWKKIMKDALQPCIEDKECSGCLSFASKLLFFVIYA